MISRWLLFVVMGGKKKAEKEMKAHNRRQRREQRNQQRNQEEDFDDCIQLNNQLLSLGLTLKIIPGDGNCLFRALGDQLNGDIHDHMKHREDVVQFMKDNREDFEPFVEDDISFDEHMRDLSQPCTFGGNDSIVAFARLHDLTVVIHQLDKPLWQVFSEGGNRNKELHISYHNGDHYNSVRKSGEVDGNGPANVHLARLHRPADNHMIVSEDHLHTNKSDESDYENTPKLNDLVAEVFRESRVKDRNKIIEALKSNNYNTEEAVRELKRSSNINVDLWSQNGTGSRIIGNQVINSNTENDAQPPKKLSAKQLKDLKKKQRRLDKHLVKKSDDTDTGQDIEFNNSFKTLTI